MQMKKAVTIDSTCRDDSLCFALFVLLLYLRITSVRPSVLSLSVVLFFQNKKKTMAQLSFNTPGSKVDRSMAFDLVLDHEDRQLEVSAASPWTKAEFKG